jgi:hypothetical protein
MKTTTLVSGLIHGSASAPVRRWMGCLAVAGVAAGAIGLAIGGQSHGLIAHEWGTFTSVQGADGVLLDWRPLESSKLPKFVYDWRHPGMNRFVASPFGGGANLSKVVLLTHQRMETPVIYFYSEQKQTVDVSVDFPQGLITEWYPQVDRIGPSAVPVPPAVATLDAWAHKIGLKPGFTFASLIKDQFIKESRAGWAHVEVLPAGDHRDFAAQLPLDSSGSHYFAARDTDAAYLRITSAAATNPAPELEKFIFYRGVGNFQTPLTVTMNAAGAVTLDNTGQEPLAQLFVLTLENGAGNFIKLDQLSPGEKQSVALDWPQPSSPDTRHSTLGTKSLLPLAQLSDRLGKQMAESLVSVGLYPREATAMVNTWKDSWFAEDGLRVLYVLPRAWTDRTLPMTLNPKPSELVRVMVGRAEVLTPVLEQRLSAELAKANGGDAQARELVVNEFKKLGRFAQPAMSLALQGANPQMSQTAWTLFQAAAQPVQGAGAL